MTTADNFALFVAAESIGSTTSDPSSSLALFFRDVDDMRRGAAGDGEEVWDGWTATAERMYELEREAPSVAGSRGCTEGVRGVLPGWSMHDGIMCPCLEKLGIPSGEIKFTNENISWV